jgi:Flp pilus assembly protein protease CpaA
MNAQFFTALPVVYLLLVSIPILFFDTKQRRVPNKYSLPALFLWLVGTPIYVFLTGEWLWSLVVPIAIAIPVFILLVFISDRGILGMGDVKLLAFMGLVLSHKSLWVWLVIPLVPMLLATLVMVILYFFSRKTPDIRLAPLAYLVYFVSVIVLFLN